MTTNPVPQFIKDRAAEWATEQLDREVEQRLEGVRDLVGFKAFEDQIRDEIAELVAAEEKLERTLDAPGGTEAGIRESITRSARKVLVGLGLLAAEPETAEDTVDPAQIEARLAVERRAAAVATEALGLVREKLAVARKRLGMLESRRDRTPMLPAFTASTRRSGSLSRRLIPWPQFPSKSL
jgi:hypothetical protein